MKHTIQCAPPNSMFFLEDAAGAKSPQIDDPSLGVWATRSCIIVACLPWIDGSTELTVSDSELDVPALPKVFDGTLDTPTRFFQVSTSEREVLSKCPTLGHFTRIRIYTNDPLFPDRIVVVLG